VTGQLLDPAKAKAARSAAIANSRRLLRAARLLYGTDDLQALAASLLTIAHEELGKSILFEGVSRIDGNLDVRSVGSKSKPSRRIRDDHETKFAGAVGLILCYEAEDNITETFERILNRQLTRSESRMIGAHLIGGTLMTEMRSQGGLSEVLGSLPLAKKKALENLVEEQIEWVWRDYDDLWDSKLSGMYVDIDPDSMELSIPGQTDPPYFEHLCATLEKTLCRLESRFDAPHGASSEHKK
jgi:AbiV family abortive infection protein